MRYRDQPTLEVTQRVHCDVATAWKFVTDINLPARCSNELQSVEWGKITFKKSAAKTSLRKALREIAQFAASQGQLEITKTLG